MQPPIPSEALQPILDELQRQSLPVNHYRNTAGDGRSQSFGLVNRRCLPPDYSRQCWKRPYLYKLLLEFGEKCVTIPYTSITVNQNYQAAPHKDRGNVGPSYLVAAGDFIGGELVMHEGDLSGVADIRYHPVVADFSKVLHSVRPFTGNRVSLVYYTLRNAPADIPPPSVILEGTKWRFKRGDEIIRTGLPHPLQKGSGLSKQESTTTIEFK